MTMLAPGVSMNEGTGAVPAGIPKSDGVKVCSAISTIGAIGDSVTGGVGGGGAGVEGAGTSGDGVGADGCGSDGSGGVSGGGATGTVVPRSS